MRSSLVLISSGSEGLEIVSADVVDGVRVGDADGCEVLVSLRRTVPSVRRRKACLVRSVAL